MALKHVVGLGLCVLDHLFIVDDFAPLRTRTRTRYRQRGVSPGGMVTTALAQASQLGCRSHLLSMVGDDPEGRLLARQLRALGLVTRGLRRSREHPTSVSLVLVDRRSGERRFVIPDRRGVERQAPPFDLAPIRRGSLLLVDGHFPARAREAIERAKQFGVTVIGDFCDAQPGVRRLLPFVDFPIVPREFVEAYGAGGILDTLRSLRDRYGSTPVVTDGPRGAFYLEGRRMLRVPARRVRVLDTTGAGDVFHGAFAAGLAHGRDVPSSLGLASRAAALSCTALGGTGRLLRSSEM